MSCAQCQNVRPLCVRRRKVFSGVNQRYVCQTGALRGMWLWLDCGIVQKYGRMNAGLHRGLLGRAVMVVLCVGDHELRQVVRIWRIAVSLPSLARPQCLERIV